MLRDPGLVIRRWARFFGTLLNSKSDKLRLSIIEGLPQWPITHALGVEPTENELTGALRSMANAKAVGPDELLIELLRFGINHDPTVLRNVSTIDDSPPQTVDCINQKIINIHHYRRSN